MLEIRSGGLGLCEHLLKKKKCEWDTQPGGGSGLLDVTVAVLTLQGGLTCTWAGCKKHLKWTKELATRKYDNIAQHPSVLDVLQ